MKTLIIVESPAKCKKIESFLGPNYKCVASYGHIRELTRKKGISCIDVSNNYTPSFSISSHQKKNIETLRKLITTYDEVLLATDDDREGEAIAWHICIVFKLPVKSTKRIIFHEITKDAIIRAVNNPTFIDMNKVQSQKARQVLDFLVGFTISPLLWKNITKSNVTGLSAGRCQTPALRLVYENYLQVKNNQGKECYTVTGYFTSKNFAYKLDKSIDSREKVESFLEESVNFDHTIHILEPKESIRKPPEPLTTSSLQQKANNELHFSPKMTMSIAQTLYELGYITYMRTDSKIYSKEFVDKTKSFILKKYNENYVNENINELCGEKNELIKSKKETTDTKGKSNKTKTKTNAKTKSNTKTKTKTTSVKAQEAHEAIRPTDIHTTSLEQEINEKLGPREKRLYYLIWKTTLQSCMSDATFNILKSYIEAPEETKYNYSEEEIVFDGWTVIENREKINTDYIYLKNLKNNNNINYNKIKTEYTLKDTKQHFTEAKLVSLLEKNGIGRPSTFSSLINKIQERGYVKKDDIEGKQIQCIEHELIDDIIEEFSLQKNMGGEKNKLILQPIGLIVIEYLLNVFPELFNYTYTSCMEEELDNINKGNKIWYELCDECFRYMNDLINNKGLNIKSKKSNSNIETPTITKTAFKIDDTHTFKIARYGPIIETKDECGKTKYIKVKDNIDLEDIRNGKLSLTDIIKNEDDDCVCIYNNEKIIIKKGKYGQYFEYKGKSYSIKPLKKHKSKITAQDVEGLINKKDTSIIREINEYLSIRTGKFGHYIFHKTPQMKKPTFHSLKGCELDYENCDIDVLIVWIRDNITEKK